MLGAIRFMHLPIYVAHQHMRRFKIRVHPHLNIQLVTNAREIQVLTRCAYPQALVRFGVKIFVFPEPVMPRRPQLLEHLPLNRNGGMPYPVHLLDAYAKLRDVMYLPLLVPPERARVVMNAAPERQRYDNRLVVPNQDFYRLYRVVMVNVAHHQRIVGTLA